MATKPRILLVDDSKAMLALEKLYLGDATYEFLTAQDGEEAIAKAIAEQPDLILMDVVMPRKDGFEACSELKRNEATRRIPIIMVTTRGEAAHLESGYVSGCNDYVLKPVDCAELVEKIRNFLPPAEEPQA